MTSSHRIRPRTGPILVPNVQPAEETGYIMTIETLDLSTIVIRMVLAINF
jgi:hypothetical protein